MSKGEALEKLTELLEKSISDKNTIVERDKKVVDLDGVQRQIDVFITSRLNRRTYITIIECKDYNRKVSIDKIESFASMCSRLKKVDKKIFVSSKGFQSGAIRKAETNNIELCIVSEYENSKENKEVTEKEVHLIEKKCTILKIRCDTRELEKKGIVNKKFELYDYEGNEVKKSIIENKLLKSSEMSKFLITKQGYLLNQKKILCLNLKFKNTFIKHEDTLHEINDLLLEVEIQAVHTQKNLNKVLRYFSYTDGNDIANLSGFDFTYKGGKYNFFIISNDEGADMFLADEGFTEKEKLVELGRLDLEIKQVEIQQTKALRVLPYTIKMADGAIKSVEESTSKKDGNPDSLFKKKINTLIGVDPQKKEAFFTMPIKLNRKIIAAKTAHPISLYLVHTLELFEKSKFHEGRMIYNASPKNIVWQDIEFHKYFQYKISSFTMLKMTIELFVNYSIEDEIEIKRGKETVGKAKIVEDFTLEDKIDIIKKKRLKKDELIGELNLILKVLTLCRSLQNINFLNKELLNQPFLEVFEEAISFDIEESLKATKVFFERLNPSLQLYDEA